MEKVFVKLIKLGARWIVVGILVDPGRIVSRNVSAILFSWIDPENKGSKEIETKLKLDEAS